MSDITHLIPPEALAALTEPCQTCRGSGVVWPSRSKGGPLIPMISVRRPCTDCENRVVYVNVGSVPGFCAACGDSGISRTGDGYCGQCQYVEGVAPPEWVKLAEATCETCGGQEPPWLPYGPGAVQTVCAARCHKGKPVHTISVPCCDRQATCTDETKPGCGWAGSGTVEYRVVVTELLPVVDRLRAEKDGGYVIVKPNHVRLYYVTGNGRYRYITVVGEPPEPGDHIVELRALS